MQLGTLSPFYAWGHLISKEEQAIRYWKHELNRASLMCDEQGKRRAESMLKRFEEEGHNV